MAKVPNPAEEDSVFDVEEFFRRNPQLRRRREQLQAWRRTLAPSQSPKPFRLLPWLGLGTREEDYPPPDHLSPEDGRILYGKSYDLWKLGIPLDFQYPMGFVFPASFYDTETARFLTEHLAESSSKAPSRAERVASYERKERKPRLKKAQQLAIRLETTMKELIAVEQRHPAYRSEYSSEPFMESPRLRDFLTIKDLARVAVDGLNQAGYVKPGRRADAIKNELQKRLRGLGLSDKKIAEALKILGLEGAGDAADRVRQRRRRQK